MQARDPASYVVRSSKFRVFQTLTYTSMPTITMSPSVKIAPIQLTETKLSPPRSMGLIARGMPRLGAMMVRSAGSTTSRNTSDKVEPASWSRHSPRNSIHLSWNMTFAAPEKHVQKNADDS